ncbi:MAG: COG3014 family protein, partial [Planctomycetota bacterium]
GPVKEEFRIDLPIFIATDRIKYIGIALPTLKYRQEAYPYMVVKTPEKSYQTELVADMDRVVQAEFNKDFQGILTRAIISTTAKAVAQYALEKQGSDAGSILSIGVAVYSLVTTSADVRIWTTLPKNFHVARFEIPPQRTITVSPPGGQPFDINIGDCKNALIFVKIPFAGTKPVFDIIKY